MTLVDTSIWIDHLRRGNSELVRMLESGEVLHHPFVYGELACGGLRNRAEILNLLAALPQPHLTTFDETIRFIEVKELFGIGLGWTDVNLLASAQLTGCGLWTYDKTLARIAHSLGLGE